jgi:NAD-dependent deacetylase
VTGQSNPGGLLDAARTIARRCGPDSRIVVVSGSGMSAESGIPTFRDAQTGLWSKYRPEDLATPEAFARHPERVWRWYQHRREQIRSVHPHDGHEALVRIEKSVTRLTIVTQNVDGLHQRSGSTRVLELHGNITRSVCSISHKPISGSWIDSSSDEPPPSPYVEGGLARPDVVWFGEALPQEAFDQSVQALRNCDVCIAVGTSALVQPAASLPLIAQDAGAFLVEINPRPTPLSSLADLCMRDTAGRSLGARADAMESLKR